MTGYVKGTLTLLAHIRQRRNKKVNCDIESVEIFIVLEGQGVRITYTRGF